MRDRGAIPLVVLCLWAAEALAAAPAPPQNAAPATTPSATSTPPPRPRKQPLYINGVPDTGQFLPDTTVLARVDDKPIRVGEYIRAYFNSYAEYRPRPDSAGRAEFLNNLLNKEVLGRTARAAGYTFGFEDRAVLRSHTQRVLSNVLFQRAVVDSAVLDEADVTRVYDQYHYQQHLRHIQFADRATAERVRLDLLRGRIGWKDAVRKYSVARDDRGPDGELGWTVRMALAEPIAEAVWPLQPNQVSEVVEDERGFHVLQSVERRSTNPPALESLRNSIVEGLRKQRIADRAERLQVMLAAQAHLVPDSVNIAWASKFFTAAQRVSTEGPNTTLEIDTTVPGFAPADTSRVLARFEHGTYSLGQFMAAYSEIPPLTRPSVNEFSALWRQVRSFVLDPYLVNLATERGLEKDSLAAAQIESKREELLVDRMYQDSVTRTIWVRPEERRAYYETHLPGYFTYAKVRYAAIVAPTRGAADSLAARLRAGEQAEAILRADSLRGIDTGSIREERENEHGLYHKLLFEELRPGQLTIEGPDKKGTYLVLQLVSYDAGRQLSFKEAEVYVDEALQNLKAEESLKAMLARLRPRYRIESHPELVMLIRLVDPTL